MPLLTHYFRFSTGVALCAVVLLTGCGSVPRTWVLGEDRPGPATIVPDTAAIEFQSVKQQDDYVLMVFTIQNQAPDPMRFKPIDAITTAWGFVLRPKDPALVLRRVSASTEPGTVILPGQTAGFECRWFISPIAEDNAWPWTLEIHGLMVGDREVPAVSVAMPHFREPGQMNARTRW
jgi:hypothetical protein